MDYTILTSHNFNGEGKSESETNAIASEQNTLLNKLGYSYLETYLIEQNESKICLATLNDAIEMLALKEGADLVIYPDGNIGFVGYYGNRFVATNHFKIICKKKEIIERYGTTRLYQLCKAMSNSETYSDDEYIEDLVEYINYQFKKEAI